MKGKLLPIAGLVLSSLFTTLIHAQEYQPLTIQSGLNADVIANGVGPSASSTNSDVDGVNYAFISRDFQLTGSGSPLSYGLPVNGIINTAVGSTSGLSYQLASYSSNNSLRLPAAGSNGTVTFSNPIPVISLFMLATGGSGDCVVDLDVNFSDGSSQSFAAVNISDWYGGSDYAIQGIGRINLTNDNLESGNGTNPRLYQIPLAINAANQSKNVQSVTVTKVSGGVPNIFAFSADAYNACSAPTNIISTTTTTTAVLSWAAPANAPSAGYQYYYSTSSTAPTATTVPSGSVAAGTTSLSLNNLTTGQTYYFWVRSNCGSSQGFWKMKEFVTGQISTTYSAGDINTEYSDLTPTTTSTASCPGTLTVNVPAGFKIKSTSVSYTMTAQAGAWMSEQKSLLVCTTNGNTETEVSSGSSSSGGTYSYNRTGLAIANNLTGNVNFELRAWRMWGDQSLGCDASYNRVDNNTWTVTVTLEPLNLATNETKTEKPILAYPNPFTDVLNIDKADQVKHAVVTDLSGIAVKNFNNPSSGLHLEGVKAGIYILTLTMKDGAVKSTKIIKR